jgi:hypothetical protein
MNRPRFTCLVVSLFVLLTVMSARPDTLEEIDRVVAELGKFVTDLVPDQQNLNLTILPFVSDRRGQVTLGDRLKSELELYLAARYRKTRIIPQPEGVNTYAAAGELQSYPGKIRVICRLTRPDGSLAGGTRIDLPSSPELLSLLEPSPVTPRGSFPPSGVSTVAPQGAAPGGSSGVEDPFEPDEAEGFEVEISSSGIQIFNRFISPGDIDRFRFYKAGAGTVVLEAQTDIDIQLLLYREGETIPFAVSGNQDSRALRVEMPLDEGYYIVELMAYDFNVRGPYTFAVDLTGTSNDGFEPDNSLAEAKLILPDTRQDRALLSGDQDWVELSFTLPGFYAVYTMGAQVDTAIALFDENQKQILSDEDGGVQDNAYIPVFLGTRRTYARITGRGSLATGSYTLAFDKIEPAQVFPGDGVQELQASETPLVFQLRVIRSGSYVIRAQGASFFGSSEAPVAVELYGLPTMRPARGSGSIYSLSSGDYLLILKSSDQARPIRFCVAPEDEAEECLPATRE